ncbi:RHS repeat-associated core domain-containing protein, partial [Pseudomonas sp. LAM2023]|uniref:RHS repeat-associated core domain-containing protein n=1 Tax=Pseudomonas sp. LAM2023 TaxID=2800477 RepID=UPI00190B5E20
CGFTLFGWDGDTLAWESSPPRDDGDTGRTVHYLYEPGSFVPVAQALRKSPIRLHKQPDWSQREYDFDQDPLWHTEVKPQAFDAIAWYQCDHLGTPMELTDEHGHIAWAGQYKAWGEVKEERSDWAKQHGLSNPIRFQGQYHDHETGLHYNRYRYYDPMVGRFIGEDPVSYAGGLNLFAYAPNPIEWYDPLGLARIPKREKTKVSIENRQYHGTEKCEHCLIDVVPGQKSQKGVTPPSNERQYDHIEPDSKGGSNMEENVQILCRKCNRGFSDKAKDNFKLLNRMGVR